MARTTGTGGAAERPLRARGRATRAKLLEAGVAVFSRKGFNATRIDDIVSIAETSHGTFYLYFESKDALFDELVAEATSELRGLTESLPPITTSASSRAALEAWLAELVEAYARYGPLIRSWTEAERPQHAAAGPHDVLAAVAEALAAKVELPPGADLDPSVAALALVAMVERVNYFSATGQLEDDPPALARTLAAIVLDALYGPGHT